MCYFGYRWRIRVFIGVWLENGVVVIIKERISGFVLEGSR